MPQLPLAHFHGTPHSLRIATRSRLTASSPSKCTSAPEVRNLIVGIGPGDQDPVATGSRADAHSPRSGFTYVSYSALV